MGKTTVARFSTQAKAAPLQQRLAEAGIAAQLRRKSALAWMWFVSRKTGDARLEVPEAQLEPALQLLQAWDQSEGVLREAIRCPECRSLRVDYPQFTRNSLLTNLALGLIAELGLVEKDFYCADCHFTWPKTGQRPRRNQAHLAPYYFIEGVEQTTLPPPQGGTPEPEPRRKAA